MNEQIPLASFTELATEAGKYIAGGVVSLNRKVSPHIVFRKGKGSKVCDVHGKEYIDYHAAFGVYLLGHNYTPVNDAVIATVQSEWSLFGSGTNALEIELAKCLCNAIPSLDLVQITNTGSEATAHAIRLSRAYTGREDIILPLGGYNGWHNDVARTVMPGLEQLGKRISPGEYPFLSLSAGIPEAVKKKVHIINFNDLSSIEYIMKKHPVACVLVEPVLQNVGIVLPKPGYLQGLVNLCEHYGAVCVFDEVKTGFRSALGGYQSVAGVEPHLSVFGKAIANGYPLGVIGGKKEIMELFDSPDPARRVLIAGTYNAHPVNTAAALATLKELEDPHVYQHIDRICDKLYNGLEQLFNETGIEAVVARNASAFCVYFMQKKPDDLHDILEGANMELDLRYRRALIKKGIYNIPIACKQGSVSFSHTDDDIDKTLEAIREVLQTI